MKARTKSVLALLVTLAIGVAIGALVWSTMHTQRVKKLREARSERGGLYSMVERRVAPLDPAVEDDVRRVVEVYHAKLHDLFDHHVTHRTALLDSMVTDLDSVLTDEQTAKLRDWIHDNDDDDDNRRRESRD